MKRIVFSFIAAGFAVLVFGLYVSCADDGDGFDADECDIDCMRSTTEMSNDCLYEYWDCREAGGRMSDCSDSTLPCYEDAWDALCDCASRCASCQTIYCECVDSCGGLFAEAGECQKVCRYDFQDCADWYDYECIYNCNSAYSWCEYYGRIEGDYSRADECIGALTECEFACLPD